jgi:protein pelota
MQAVLRHVNFEIIKCVLIASPGFVKDQFFDYMFQMAQKMDNKILLENKGKFVLVHASSGFKHSLRGLDFRPVLYTSSILTMYR